MSDAMSIGDGHSSAEANIHARVAGVLLLLSLVAGAFGEMYVPSRLLVSGDAAATAHNIEAFGRLFRAGFASYLVEAVCDVALALIFYVLLKPVHKSLALLAAFFGLVSTTLFAVAELFYFAALPILDGAGALKALTVDQRSALAQLALELYGYGGGIFMVFYGIANIVRGYLILRSGYLPRLLGLLLVIAGLGFVAKNVALVLAPAHASDLLVLPMFLAMVALTVRLLVRGVDAAKWESAVARARAPRRA